MKENEIGDIVVDCAVKVHMRLGPGLLESVYEAVLSYELQNRGLSIQQQVPISITYDDILFEEGFRADLVVDGKVILVLLCHIAPRRWAGYRLRDRRRHGSHRRAYRDVFTACPATCARSTSHAEADATP